MNLEIPNGINLGFNTITKSTTPMETKHDHSVEIYRKSHDMNLEIPHGINLGFNSKAVEKRTI
jgi:hypothetical protein